MNGTSAANRGAGGLARFALLLCIVAVAQTATLVWMIYDRVSLVSGGREVVLDTAPVDPRSLFRGDYVILNYQISALDSRNLDGADEFVRGSPIFVTLEKPDSSDRSGQPTGWKPVSIAAKYPSDTGENQVVIRGRLLRGGASALRVSYGIESYFVPEGEGKRLEKLARTGSIQVLVAVGRDGEAAIKGLLIDGKLRYEEPLF